MSAALADLATVLGIVAAVAVLGFVCWALLLAATAREHRLHRFLDWMDLCPQPYRRSRRGEPCR